MTGVDGDVMTVAEAACFLRLGRNALYDAIARGCVFRAIVNTETGPS